MLLQNVSRIPSVSFLSFEYVSTNDARKRGTLKQKDFRDSVLPRIVRGPQAVILQRPAKPSWDRSRALYTLLENNSLGDPPSGLDRPH